MCILLSATDSIDLFPDLSLRNRCATRLSDLNGPNCGHLAFRHAGEIGVGTWSVLLARHPRKPPTIVIFESMTQQVESRQPQCSNEEVVDI
jgi:hypothetical protein